MRGVFHRRVFSVFFGAECRGHCSYSCCWWRRVSSMSAKGVAMKEEELRVLVLVASFPAAFLDEVFFGQSLSL